ncbi:hypothetical protein ONE63_006357 [Megalurothrips usitatus]|uniref:Phosphatidylinositol-4-phosphate 3-kinase n=1 Tax=Megalurothrips usitatus TaxID=439358 RepID=A0AAV7XVP8_9NEOP|nr:hypothetical protein ONE63_006357 [Megalurothrips usitatus]
MNGKQQVKSDQERQFEEDLERARALSLESLALEKFRLCKQQKELERLHKTQNQSHQLNVASRSKTELNERKLSAPQPSSSNVLERLELKSRPRPGSFNSGTSRNPPILAPPPSSTRRISVSSTDDAKDLISFSSPDCDDKSALYPDLDQLCGSFETQMNRNDSLPNNVKDALISSTPRLNRSNSSASNFGSLRQLSLDNSPHPAPSLSHSHSDSVAIRGTQFQGFSNVNNLSTLSNMSSISNMSNFSNISNSTFSPSALSTSAPFLGCSAAQPYHLVHGMDTLKASSSMTAFGAIMANPVIPVRSYELRPHILSNGSIDSGLSMAGSSSLSQTPLPAITQGSESSGGLDVLKVVEKRDNSNLIDLSLFDSENENKLSFYNGSNGTTVRTSVLEAFDPLLTSQESGSARPATIEEVGEKDETASQCSGSIYDPYDPFDFMYAPSEGSQSDPVYAAVVRKKDAEAAPSTPSGSAPPPLPPRNYATKKADEKKQNRHKSFLHEDISQTTCNTSYINSDLRAFHKMVLALRAEHQHDDIYTNTGLVTASSIESHYSEGTSIKLVVRSLKENSQPVIFTCDVDSTVEHVILHVICELEGDVSGEASDYVLRVWGFAEYLTPNTSLSDYEYVHNCIKLDEDVTLAIMHMDEVSRPLARTPQDDNRDKTLTLENLLPNEPVTPISYDSLLILLETLEREMDRLNQASKQATGNAMLQPKGVLQSVKAVCAVLGSVETSEITEAMEGLIHHCQLRSQPYAVPPPQQEAADSLYRTEIGGDDGYYSVVTLRRKANTISDSSNDRLFSEIIANHCEKIRDAVQHLIETYCQAFRVNFQLVPQPTVTAGTRCLSSVNDCVLVHIDGLHRLQASWDHDEYLIAGQVYHGTRPIGHTALTRPMAVQNSFYKRVLFDFWLNFDSLSVNMLPRESRLVLVLYGRSLAKSADNNDHDSHDTSQQMSEVELGWASLQFFNYDGVLTQGNFLLSLWPANADKRLGPAPLPGSHPHSDVHPVLGVELPDYGGTVMFPSANSGGSVANAPTYDFGSLDSNTQNQLMDIIDQDTFTRPLPEDREVLWEKRHYLHHKPEALAKVILAAHDWDHCSAFQIHALLHSWTPMEPVQALQLLLPCYPDGEVRKMAVAWIQGMGRDEIIDYLPQLVQALKHETYDSSPLAAFLLRRALCSPRVAHHLYWLLTQSLPGQCPQNSSEPTGTDDISVSEARYHRRLQLVLRALLSISGEALKQRFFSQQMLVKGLLDVAQSVKGTKESLRLQTLQRDLEWVHRSLEESSFATCLPLSPALEVSGIQVRTSSYFPSNTLPLKINFIGCNSGIIPAIFKVGDDLQQDMLTIQMIRIMDKLWLKEGLDLKMVTFTCVPTGHTRGMIEMVQQAETLRKIHTELGLTGSFKDRPIAEWLAKHNPSALEYERAVSNFTASCAGYSVATYILGICDRHNDNIMLKTSGHLFHIDFGKFLGDAQMFGNFKRDRAPFVLTSDMAYVINGGDKPSAKFHHFVDLCCQAFNIVRKHGNLILNMFGLMASSGIPGVTMDAVKYVQKALLQDVTNPEAAAYFARMIQSSLKSWFTQFNFFLHNLSQLRFTGDHNDGELLSFIPKTYTMQQEGRIKSVAVYGCQKRYDPEKYYLYILRVERANQPDPTFLFRSYKEFCELQQKLCIHFPLAKCHSLTGGLHMGRSNIKQVAEKRRIDIEKFLVTLFRMADEISHSDLVYTFFHPLLRDQEEVSMANIHAAKFKEKKAPRPQGIEAHRLKGQLKLSLQYQRGTLMVMVHHARELPFVAGQEPSAYVKVYLLPDPSKATKRKTKVVRRNCHPTFMEMIEYRMPLDVICHRSLQATVWNHDTLQENEFLGGISLPLESCDLSKEVTEWYSLGNVCR